MKEQLLETMKDHCGLSCAQLARVMNVDRKELLTLIYSLESEGILVRHPVNKINNWWIVGQVTPPMVVNDCLLNATKPMTINQIGEIVGLPHSQVRAIVQAYLPQVREVPTSRKEHNLYEHILNEKKADPDFIQGVPVELYKRLSGLGLNLAEMKDYLHLWAGIDELPMFMKQAS